MNMPETYFTQYIRPELLALVPVLYVIGNLFAPFLAAEIVFRAVNIIVEQLVCVFVNGVNGAKDID